MHSNYRGIEPVVGAVVGASSRRRKRQRCWPSTVPIRRTASSGMRSTTCSKTSSHTITILKQDHKRRNSASHPPTPSFVSYHSLRGLSTSQVHTSPFEILRRVSKIQRHFSGKSKSSLLSGGGASGAFARRKTTCDLGCDLW